MIPGLFPMFLYICDWTRRSVWRETFTYGSLGTQGWNSPAWPD